MGRMIKAKDVPMADAVAHLRYHETRALKRAVRLRHAHPKKGWETRLWPLFDALDRVIESRQRITTLKKEAAAKLDQDERRARLRNVDRFFGRRKSR